eukprot:366250-Chlamydomonas_euryale.AAC.14
MSLASLPGNDFWSRLVLLISDPSEWRKYVASKKPGDVTSCFVALYTVLQFCALAGIWALVTWAGIAGVCFPVPMLALVPLRAFLLPRLLRQNHYDQLVVLDPCNMQ